MNQEQKKYLKERLQSAVRAHRDAEPKRPPQPANVKAARNLVMAWDAKGYTWGKRYRTRIDAAAAKVREIVLFRESDVALKAVVAFEKRSFR